MTPALFVASSGPASSWHDFLVVNGWARHTGWLHGFMTVYAGDGVALFGLLLLAGWWVARRSGDPRRMALALWAGIATVVAVAVNQPIVNSVHEARPYSVLPHILVLAHRSADPSFPSDHATMAGAVAVGLFLVSRRLGVVATAAALLMAFARVYVGAHWPRDVIAGLILGAAVALVGHLVAAPVLTRAISWASNRTSLRPLLTAYPSDHRAGTAHAGAAPGRG
jgi:undecaprenyl-diphosphatase